MLNIIVRRDALDLTEYTQKRLGGLDAIFKDFNVLSVIGFTPAIIPFIFSICIAFYGIPQWLLITAPWFALMIGYWYWRFKYLRVRCREHRRKKDVLEYEKTLKLDSVRTSLLASMAVSTVFYLFLGGGGVVLFVVLFLSYLGVMWFIIVLEVLEYWYSKRQDLKQLES
jgi:uncharacterized membrane protein YdjX (TVP38/TMEM64 family)